MTVYTAHVSRSGNWWHIAVPQAGQFAMTQVRRLEQVDAMTRDMLATLLNVAPDSFDIAIELADSELTDSMNAVAAARKQADEADQRAQEATRAQACRLVEKGLPVRDIAKLLHISRSQVSVLTRAH